MIKDIKNRFLGLQLAGVEASSDTSVLLGQKDIQLGFKFHHVA